MPYENFPYADLHNLNLDWLLKKVKEMGEVINMVNLPQLVSDKIDEMVADGTMDEIVNDHVFNNLNDQVQTIAYNLTSTINNVTALQDDTASATVAMLGCPAANTLDSSRGYSLCIVIHSPDFCVVYDMGNDNAATLLGYLAANNITKVDAFIISHYHEDHVQTVGVSNVCSRVDVENWYLPHKDLDWNSYTGTPTYDGKEAAVKTAIEFWGDTYIQPSSEGYSVTFADKCKVEFFNLASAYYTGYYSYMRDEDYNTISHTNYNNFSMCARVTIGGQMLALTGDIEMPAQDNMADMIKGADILQIPHHGLDLIDSQTFRNAMSGKIFLTAAYGIARDRRLGVVSNLMLHHARELGCSISNVDDGTVLCTMGGEGCQVDVVRSGVVTPAGYFGDVLRPGDDLDDLVEIGREYFIQNASDASGISNIPETGAGKVYVRSCNQNSNDSTGSIMQYYEASFSYAHPKIYVRWKYEGTWTSWMQYEATSI